MTAPLRVAVLGYGLAGRTFHAGLIAAEPDLEVTAVVTANPERAAQAQADLPGVTVLAHADDVWADADRFDLAVVATANSAHVPQARAAMQAGLHVVVDKPLAGTAAEAQELIDLAAATHRQLHVFQNRRWDSEILTARRVLSEGVLGRPHRLESSFERWRPDLKGGWREDGPAEDLPGQFYDLGSHLVDQAVHLMGPVESVVASVRVVRDGARADDDSQLMLWHTSGAVSLLHVGSVAAFHGPRLRLLGTRGGLEVIGLDTQEDALRAGRSPLDVDWGVEPPAAVAMLVTADDPEPQLIPRTRGDWASYYRGVAASIRGEGVAPIDPRDVVQNLRILEAGLQSSATASRVDLDPPAGHV